jgi:signal transduction histidine kinase
VDLSVPPELAGPGATGTRALLGAVREALTNVAKHAGTDCVEVRARAVDGGVEVVVADAGRGYDPVRVPSGAGQRGSIVDRVAEAGGRTMVESAPGRGTRVRLWVPR